VRTVDNIPKMSTPAPITFINWLNILDIIIVFANARTIKWGGVGREGGKVGIILFIIKKELTRAL